MLLLSSLLGPSIMYVLKIFGIFDPLPPMVRILARFVRLNSRNLPHYVHFWAPSPLPLGAYVLYGCPLSITKLYVRCDKNQTKFC